MVGAAGDDVISSKVAPIFLSANPRRALVAMMHHVEDGGLCQCAFCGSRDRPVGAIGVYTRPNEKAFAYTLCQLCVPETQEDEEAMRDTIERGLLSAPRMVMP